MDSLAPLLAALAAIILATKLLADVAQRFGQPAVLGELVAGIVLGPGLLNFLDPRDPVLEALAGLGVLVLLFEIGLHTDIRSLRRVGRDAVVVAVVGVAAPFAGGYAVASAFGLGPMGALFTGAALTATSIGISARVLRDIGRLDSPEGQIVLGAAVLDDLIGLVILGVVAATLAGQAVTLPRVGAAAAVGIGFVIVAIVVGEKAVPPIFRMVERIRSTGALGLIALAFAFLLAMVAEAGGSAMIIGALSAGLVLHGTPQRAEIERSVAQLGYFFVPIFFAVIGATVDFRAIADSRALLIGVALTVVAVLGKVATGFALRSFDGNRMLVGVAMVPRGEVGLIFAQVGLASGAIAAGEFGAIMLMVIVTTLITPPWLSAVTRTRATHTVDPTGAALDDLVSGVRPMTPRATQPVRRDYKDE